MRTFYYEAELKFFKDIHSLSGFLPLTLLKMFLVLQFFAGGALLPPFILARRVFLALDGINIRMISQGASLLNLSFVIAEADLSRTVAALHEEFFAELDPAVFERNEAAHA